MGCRQCEESRRRAANNGSTSNYYNNNFTNTNNTSKVQSAHITNEIRKECEVKYSDLITMYQDIGKNTSIPSEIRDTMRLQVAEWVRDIKTKCPNNDKFLEIRSKLDGTDISKDR